MTCMRLPIRNTFPCLFLHVRKVCAVFTSKISSTRSIHSDIRPFLWEKRDFDRFHVEGDVALLARKPNQSWSVPQVTTTTRMSEESKTSPQKKNKKKPNAKRCTEGGSPLSANLTITTAPSKTGRENHVQFHSHMLSPPDGACTSLPSHPTLCYCSPSLMGDNANAPTVDVTQARKPPLISH